MIKNEYKLFEDHFVVYIEQRNGNRLETYFSIEDFDFISQLDAKIHADYDKNNNYYIKITKYKGISNGIPIYETSLLHRLIMGITDTYTLVDHKNLNTLDNRRENLRITNKSENSKNRRIKNSNNKSGYRNVCKIGKHWRIQLQINGKNNLFKEKFDNPKDAGKFAESMRQIYYGEFAGKVENNYMKYMGSKNKIAKEILPIILKERKKERTMVC